MQVNEVDSRYWNQSKRYPKTSNSFGGPANRRVRSPNTASGYGVEPIQDTARQVCINLLLQQTVQCDDAVIVYLR